MHWSAQLGMGAVIAVGAFAAGRFVANVASVPTPSTATTRTGPTTDSRAVGAIGWLEPDPKLIVLAAPTSLAESALVGELLVEEGDWVAADSLLAKLDSYDRRLAAITEGESKLKVAQANLASVQAGSKPADISAQQANVDRLAAAFQLASDEKARSQALLASDATTEEAYEQAATRVIEAEQALNEAKFRLESLNTVRAEDIAIAEAEVSTSQAALLRLKSDLRLATIVAPTEGQVLKIHARRGEAIGSEGFADFGNTRRMCAIAEVYEGDVPAIQIGQSASVEIESLPGSLSGYVIQVGQRVGRRTVLDNDPVKDTDARVVEVRVLLKPEDAARVAALSYARVRVVINVDSPPVSTPALSSPHSSPTSSTATQPEER